MTLEELIKSNPDPRELKRALAVKMRLQGMKHREIQQVLAVHSSYISRWEKKFQEGGVEKIRLGHKGSKGYLDETKRIAVTEWIRQKSERNLWEVIDHLESSYGIIYRSMQSYYQLLKSAGMSWQKGRKSGCDPAPPTGARERAPSKVPAMMNLWCRSTIK